MFFYLLGGKFLCIPLFCLSHFAEVYLHKACTEAFYLFLHYRAGIECIYPCAESFCCCYCLKACHAYAYYEHSCGVYCSGRCHHHRKYLGKSCCCIYYRNIPCQRCLRGLNVHFLCKCCPRYHFKRHRLQACCCHFIKQFPFIERIQIAKVQSALFYPLDTFGLHYPEYYLTALISFLICRNKFCACRFIIAV